MKINCHFIEEIMLALLLASCSMPWVEATAPAPLPSVIFTISPAVLPLTPSPVSSPSFVPSPLPPPTPQPTTTPKPLAQLLQLGRGTINQIALSPDGKTLAAGGSEGVRLYTSDTLQFIRQWGGYTTTVRSLDWSPVGDQLAAGRDDGTVLVGSVNALDKSEIEILSTITGRVDQVKWSPQGELLATSIYSYSVEAATYFYAAQVMDVQTGRELWQMKGGMSLAWSLDRKHLAIGFERAGVGIFDAETGKSQPEMLGGPGPANSVAWSPDGKLLATGEGYHDIENPNLTARIWRVWDRQQLLHWNLPAPASIVAWSSDGATLAVGRDDQQISLLDVSTGQEHCTLSQAMTDITTLVWLPNGKRLASGGRDGVLRLWDTVGCRQLRESQENVDTPPVISSLAWSADGEQIALGGQNGTIEIRDTRQWQVACKLQGHQGAVNSVKWLLNENVLASGGDDGTVRIWDTTACKNLRTLPRLESNGYSSIVASVAWSPDGRRLATANCCIAVQIWDTTTWEVIGKITEEHYLPTQLAWAADGQELVTAGENNPIEVWNNKGKNLFTTYLRPGVEQYTYPGLSIASSPDNSRVLLGGGYDHIFLFSIQKRHILELKGKLDRVNTVSWSQQGDKWALGCSNGLIQIWDAIKQQPLQVLEGHDGGVTGVAWSPSGDTLVSTGEDGIVRIWGVPEP